MNSEPDNKASGLDARLAHLPQWQPPIDFAARLAAAAARQAAQPMVKPPTTLGWLVERFVYHLPLTLGAGLVALVLAVTPWGALVGSSALPWLVAAAAVATGLALTVRLLRAP